MQDYIADMCLETIRRRAADCCLVLETNDSGDGYKLVDGEQNVREWPRGREYTSMRDVFAYLIGREHILLEH